MKKKDENNESAKKKSKSQLRKILWKLVSEYVRRRDSNHDGYVECVTCETVALWNSGTIHAGHFVGGRRNSILYELTNIHGQCYACNVCRYGETLKYLDFMIDKYGKQEVVRLRSLNEKSVTFTVQDYERMILEFKEKIRNL